MSPKKSRHFPHGFNFVGTDGRGSDPSRERERAVAGLTALTQGGLAAADIKRLRSAAGATCVMSHGSENQLWPSMDCAIAGGIRNPQTAPLALAPINSSRTHRFNSAA